MSTEDIEKGARWSTQITTELNATRFLSDLPDTRRILPRIGYIPSPVHLPKVMDRSNVVPILFKLKSSDVQGRLTQFQMANFDKDEMCRKLLISSLKDLLRLFGLD